MTMHLRLRSTTTRTPTRTPLALTLMGAAMACAPLAWTGAHSNAWAQADAPKARSAQDTPPAPGGQEVDLRPKFKKGQITKFTMQLESSGSVGGATQTTNQTIGLSFHVKDVTSDGAKVDMVYDSLKLSIDGPLGKTEFDSTKPNPDDPMAGLLEGIVGLTLALDVNAAGTITNITPVPKQGSAVPQELLAQFTGADLIKGLFGPVLTIRGDDGRAKVGETWTNESTMSAMLGTTRLRNEYTLASYSAPRATMSIKGTVSIDGNAASPAKVDDGTISGSAVWNTEEGMLESMRMTQKMKVQLQGIAGSEGGGTQSEQTMNVTISRRT